MTLDKVSLTKVANTIRGLSMDAVEAANSGHPGLPLGCAELMAYLYGYQLIHNPDDADWVNRDRFVLSAGHGSMVLYSALHLAGFDVSLDNIKEFRQIHSKTAGHPEYGEIPGVETTSGPLGQGFATSVGMALASKMLSATFNSDFFDSTTYVLASDGCLMEGVTSEASSIAGHLSLDNLVVIYDSNDICLDGSTDECFSEDTALRYTAYGWFVQTIDGHSFDDIHQAIQLAKESNKPALIIAKTVIGKGSPGLQGTSDIHGKAMGADEVLKTKEYFGIPTDQLFYVPQDVRDFFACRNAMLKENYLKWQESFYEWKINHPDMSDTFDQFQRPINEKDLKTYLDKIELSKSKATRSQSSELLQQLAEYLPNLIGGSADLSCSDNTFLKKYSSISSSDFTGRNIKYGVREFSMACIASGLSLSKLFRPYVGTFLMFSDYMRNAVRLASLMSIPVMYQFTHDSVFLGEDGPTHQPVEHLASLRAMPNLTVCRPADETEVKASWFLALTRESPTAVVLSRQNTESLLESNFELAIKGGYVLLETKDAEITIFSTGSECSLAMMVARSLIKENISARVVSLLSWEVFYEQDSEYKLQVVGNSNLNVSIEAQSSFGWERFIGLDGISISIDQFGLSGKYKDLKHHFGFEVDEIIKKIKQKLISVKILK